MLMNKFNFGKKPDMIGVDDTDALSDPVRTKAIAERTAYRNSSGHLIIPALNLTRALILAAGRVSTKLPPKVAANIQVLDDLVLLNEKGKPLTEFVTSILRGKNPASGGSIPLIRAEVPKWKGKLSFHYGDGLQKTDLDKVVEALGTQVGFLDYNAAHKGPYGQFTAQI
jgi:hypothetical protein